MASLLATPTSNEKILTHRQNIIKAFLANPALVQRITSALEVYHTAEESLLSFWTPTDPLYSKSYREYMQKKFYASNPETNKADF